MRTVSARHTCKPTHEPDRISACRARPAPVSSPPSEEDGGALPTARPGRGPADRLADADPVLAPPFAETDAERVAALWARFKATGDRGAREELILLFAPLVTMVANRVGAGLPTSVEQADLVSYGMFGLIDAIEKYETDRAVKFETYASSRIRGAIIDELRAIDWIPRSVRTKARAVDRAFAELEASCTGPRARKRSPLG